MPPRAHVFVLAGEDNRHFRAISRLVDRRLTEIHGVSNLNSDRTWSGPEHGRNWWRLGNAFVDARAARLPVYGHFDGKPGCAEAGMVRAQLLLWQRVYLKDRNITAGFIARDTDGRQRIEGARQAIAAHTWPFHVVLAYPEPEIEAWLVAGFLPRSADERKRLADISQRLGFSPPSAPERLTSTVAGSHRDAKSVFEQLVGGEESGEDDCLELEFGILEERGRGCGLQAFLAMVDETLGTIFRQGDAS